MSDAELITDNEFEKTYRLETGEIITIKFDDANYEMNFYDENGNQIGDCFKFVDESDYDYPSSQERYLLGRMYSPRPQLGLGRACLEFFLEIHPDAKIYTRPDDGQKRDDGSHLTEDAPGFVIRMIEEGLIEGNDIAPDDCEYE